MSTNEARCSSGFRNCRIFVLSKMKLKSLFMMASTPGLRTLSTTCLLFALRWHSDQYLAACCHILSAPLWASVVLRTSYLSTAPCT